MKFNRLIICTYFMDKVSERFSQLSVAPRLPAAVGLSVVVAAA